MENFKIGIIGIGNISDVYIKNLQKYPDIVTVWGCASRGLEKAKAKAEQYDIPWYYASGDELIADPDIDIVLNLTTPDAHYYYNKKALEAGKHVYSEKPLAATFTEGQELLSIAWEKGLKLGCAPDTFMGGRLQTYREIIDGGELGTVFGATVTSVCHGFEWFHPNPDFFYQRGAGPLFDIGPYYVTALLSLFGSVKSVNAMGTTAQSERLIWSEPHDGEIIHVSPEIFTYIIANMEFQSGVLASLIMSFDVWDSGLPRLEIYGTKGTLSMLDPDPNDGPNLFGGEVLLRNEENYRWKKMPRNPEEVDTPWENIPVTYAYNSTDHDNNSRGIGLLDLAYAIIEDREPRAGGAMALHALEVMEGIIHSARSHRGVEMTTECSVPPLLPEYGFEQK